jgi:hypothetical protein
MVRPNQNASAGSQPERTQNPENGIFSGLFVLSVAVGELQFYRDGA